MFSYSYKQQLHNVSFLLVQAKSDIECNSDLDQTNLYIHSGKSCTFTANHETLSSKLAQVFVDCTIL